MSLTFRPVLCLRLAGCLLALSDAALGLPATVTLGDLVQTYDGAPKTPSVITNPPGLGVTWRFVDPTAPVPQPTTETVFRNAPSTLALSYPSVGLAATQTWGIGDYVQLAGSARTLGSVDVVMVTWAKAANYPTQAAANASGWYHPIRVIIYDMNASGVLSYMGEVSREIFVPWRPLTLPNGQNYPYNGYAFQAHFELPNGFALPERPMILVTFNAQSTGFDPIGISGPYNELNVAVGGSATVGSDVNTSGILWVQSATTWSYPAIGVGAPMISLNAYRAPEPGTAEPPIHAGAWQVTATVNDPAYVGTASGTLVIGKANATVILGDLTAAYDGAPKPVVVTTDPADLTVKVTYDGSLSPPVAAGTYGVRAEIEDTNYQGTGVGELRVGNNLASWLGPWVQNGSIDAGATGDNEDPDRDGICNLLEYAWALDPSAANPELPGGGVPQLEYSKGQLALVYRKNLTASDLEFQVEAATRLDGAQAWAPAVTVDTVLADSAMVQTIRATLAVAPGEPRCFVRLRVVRR